MDDTTLTLELQELFDTMSLAWEAGDADTFAGWYARDATAILPGFRLGDREAIRSGMGLAFEGALRGTRRVHRVLEARRLGDDAVVTTTASATLAPGETVAAADRAEWGTWVLVRGQDAGGAGWRVKAYHGCPQLTAADARR